MRKVDLSGMNLATEIEWRHHGYVVKIDTVRSGGRRCSYDIFSPDDSYVGGAASLREAADFIGQERLISLDLPSIDLETGRPSGGP